MNRIETMRQQLEAQLHPSHLMIHDDSAAHVGHAGAQTGMGHFTVEIASEQFAGKGRVACHQLVYAALGDLMQTDIHALRIIIKS